MTETARLTTSDGQPNDYQGSIVAVSGDGSTIASFAGTRHTVHVFIKPVSDWASTSTFAAILTPSDAVAPSRFGSALSFDTNASLLVVGAYNANVGSHTQQGAAYVIARPGGGWAIATEAARLTSSDGAADDSFAWSVAISGDGQTLLAGSYWAAVGDNEAQGAVYQFREPGGGWATVTESAKLIAVDGAFGNHLGAGVSLSSDGAKIVAGAVGASVSRHGISGAAYVFGAGVRVFLPLVRQ